MDITEGALWGFRLFLFRDPADRAELDALAAGAETVEALRARFVAHPEFADLFRRIGYLDDSARFPVDLRHGLEWACRFFLRREPSPGDIDLYLPHTTSVNDLRNVFFSREAEDRSPDARQLQDLTVLRRFAPFSNEPVGSEAFRNFFGSVTRLSFLPPAYGDRAGWVESVPQRDGAGMHGMAEWVGTLRAVLEARASGRLRVIELGAGWAPWLVVAALAARRQGIEDVRLVGVEGSADHHAFMFQHFRDNGVAPEGHELIHAVIGVEDGVARFPRLPLAHNDYGAFAVFEPSETEAARRRGELEEVRCVGLSGLLARTGRTDLVHMDIQGHEAVVLSGSIEALNTHVRRLVVGTHSRRIEAELFDLFVAHGWYLEFEKPCDLIQLADGALYHPGDGEQVWRNPRV